MAKQIMSIEAFEQLVREYIQEAVREEMLKDLARVQEGTAGTLSTTSSTSTTGTSGTTATTGTKSSIGSNPGNADPANNVMVPGTNMNINQGLQAAAKETNFKKKAELVNKMSTQIQGMKGLVIK
jgi:hypothetical protein